MTNSVNSNSGIGILIHQTSMFREPITDEFVLNYVRNKSKTNNVVSLVSAGCSSGEEPMSYLILLDDFLDKLDISAFDLDEKSIENAKCGRVLIGDDFAEAFLLDSKLKKNNFQKICYEKFRKYFTPTGNKVYPEKNLRSTLFKIFAYQRYKAQILHEYVIDKEILKHVRFFNGDIRKLTKFYKPNSLDVLLFRNAMYHLLCEQNIVIDNRVEKKGSYNIMKNIAQKMNKVMKIGGLVIFGENERKQGIRLETVSKAMYNCGFRPVFVDDACFDIPFEKKTQDDEYYSAIYSNVWKKIANIQ